MNKYKYKLGFIGAGNMAKAIVGGVLSSKLLAAGDIAMSRKSEVEAIEGVFCTQDNSVITQQCEYVVIAVKPQIFKQIANELRPIKAKCVISIMAGITSQSVADALGLCCGVIRVMPNTPSKVGCGATAIAENEIGSEYNAFCRKMFESVGSVAYVPEKDFDAVTCVSGSGPAYVFYFIKSMVDAGVANGLSEQVSRELTLATVEGACKLAANSTDDLDTLISNVCSKGGTTIQAIDTFRSAGMDKIILDGMTACRKRSEELGKA